MPPPPCPGHTPVYKLAEPGFLPRSARRLYPETDFDGCRLTITAASTFAPPPPCTRVTTTSRDLYARLCAFARLRGGRGGTDRNILSMNLTAPRSIIVCCGESRTTRKKNKYQQLRTSCYRLSTLLITLLCEIQCTSKYWPTRSRMPWNFCYCAVNLRVLLMCVCVFVFATLRQCLTWGKNS